MKEKDKKRKISNQKKSQTDNLNQITKIDKLN